MSTSVHTDDRSLYQFFRIASNQINLRVRASQDAHIIITSQPFEGPPCYEIFFGEMRNTKTVIRKNQQEPFMVEASTPGILNQFDFTNLWVRWDAGMIAAGTQGSSMPMVSYHDSLLFPVQYFGIRTGRGTSGDWLIDSPLPMSSQFSYPASQPAVNPYYPQPSASVYPPAASKPRWTSCSDGAVPPGAVVGGHDVGGEVLYVARAFHSGATLPGKFVPSHKVAYVAWGGKEISKNHYEILCDHTARWLATSDDSLPYGAMICGRTEDGESLYVGRAYHEGSLVPGKVQLSHRVCYIPFAGAEVAKSQYEILTV